MNERTDEFGLDQGPDVPAAHVDAPANAVSQYPQSRFGEFLRGAKGKIVSLLAAVPALNAIANPHEAGAADKVKQVAAAKAPIVVEQAKYIQLAEEEPAAPVGAPNLTKVVHEEADIVPKEVKMGKTIKVNARWIPPVPLDTSDAPHLQEGLIKTDKWVVREWTYSMTLDAKADIPAQLPPQQGKQVAMRWSAPLPRADGDVRPAGTIVSWKVPRNHVLVKGTVQNVHVDPVITNNTDDSPDPRGNHVSLGIVAMHPYTGRPYSLAYDCQLEVTAYVIGPAPLEGDPVEILEDLKKNDPHLDAVIADAKKHVGVATKTKNNGRQWVKNMMKDHEKDGVRAVNGIVLRDGTEAYVGPYCDYKGVSILPDGTVELEQGKRLVMDYGLQTPLMNKAFPADKTNWLNTEYPFDAQLPTQVPNPGVQGVTKEPVTVKGSKFTKKPSVRIISPTEFEARTGLDPDVSSYIKDTLVRQMKEGRKPVQAAAADNKNQPAKVAGAPKNMP